ncbi:hypothetical protein TTHERM_000499373 (macronuclear) [Tetrahymena thermophila SB210]|uniref:Uncharacterized protein n=1 Tax=Tetrahymena thermophila (strain SB210) TaxID=312017 RepID=W7X0R6_TETTS|nr:hypothetical protein TTHERM_000499373 [Tetrahymena thermophila SB210]EWS72755.1 hypothetical protein TTHERM_000499373 [Tetrahymena thermophila SB210]|eukprot:XP_012654692.1 hypothetical protein TTHERM_000499373 [Tetrahymena thermophila SB210]
MIYQLKTLIFFLINKCYQPIIFIIQIRSIIKRYQIKHDVQNAWKEVCSQPY